MHKLHIMKNAKLKLSLLLIKKTKGGKYNTSKEKKSTSLDLKWYLRQDYFHNKLKSLHFLISAFS